MVWFSFVYTVNFILIRAIKRAGCFHKFGHDAKCNASGTLLMLLFGIIELILSQFPNLEKITWLSIMAAIMSFAYSFIGLGLSVGKWIGNGLTKGDYVGIVGLSPAKKTWSSFQALGNIAFAYTFAEVLIEIQVHEMNCSNFLADQWCIGTIQYDPLVKHYTNTLRSFCFLFFFFIVGYTKAVTTRECDNEKGIVLWSWSYHHILPFSGLCRLCCIWE